MVSLDFHTHSQVSFQLINPRHRAPRVLRSLDFLGARQVPGLLAAGKSSAGGCGLLPSCSSSELTKLALSQAIPALQAPRIALIIAAPLELWEGSTHSSHPVLLLYKSLAPISNADENKPSVCLLWSLFFFFPQNNHLAPYFEIHQALLLAHCPSAQSYSTFPCSSSNNLLCTLCLALQAQPLQGSLSADLRLCSQTTRAPNSWNSVFSKARWKQKSLSFP